YDFPLTNYERKRTNVLATIPGLPQYDSNINIPRWEGLCHAWAPAAMLFKNPAPIKVRNADGIEIAFGSSDIKALLISFLHVVGSKQDRNFLGSRCSLDFAELRKKVASGEISEKQMKALMENKECTDTNAGAFHVVLTNQIGLMNEGFIVDLNRDAEVWNQPVYAYRTNVLSESDGASEGAAPETVREILVETQVDYISEVTQSWVPVIEHGGIATETYSYRLELNNRGAIVGGAWVTFQRPDFIWKRKAPAFSGFFLALEELYKESTKESTTSH
ncbi:MAG: hypothetical protein HQK53_05340, partial [Oligoflexia bacterium]|nr:hypothetical protein [Oligoflexia bacterium]